MSGVAAPFLCGDYLDETCPGGCESFKFALGKCGCGVLSIASGCDGEVCLVATGNPQEDCLCGDPSLKGFNVSVLPFSSGSSGGGSAELNCEGKAGYQVNTCGTYQWRHLVPPVADLEFCYESTSGFFDYTIQFDGSGDPIPASCNRFVPIHIGFKNHWCQSIWDDTGSSPPPFIDVSSSDAGDTSSTLTISFPYGWESCNTGVGNGIHGGVANRTFCTSCDRCDYEAIITVCNGPQDPGVLLTLPGTVTGIPASWEPTFTIGDDNCTTKCKSTTVSGYVGRGKHFFELNFQTIRNPVPIGAYAEMEINWLGCTNDCSGCLCTYLDDSNLEMDYYDRCFGIQAQRTLSLTYDGEACTWTSPFIESSKSNGGKRCSHFVLICDKPCCDNNNYLSGIFLPKDMSPNLYGIYLYEFYDDSNVSGHDCSNFESNFLDYDYYIWTPYDYSGALEFKRTWHRCDGAVNPTCNHIISIDTTCSAGDGCFSCWSAWGAENHLPLLGASWILYDDDGNVLQSGIASDPGGGITCFSATDSQLPISGVLFGLDCYEEITVEIPCNIAAQTYVPTSTGCIVHSGTCTLSDGLPYNKTLHLTDNFGNQTFNWNGTRWASTDFTLYCSGNQFKMEGNVSGCYYAEFSVGDGLSVNENPLLINISKILPAGGCLGSDLAYGGTITE